MENLEKEELFMCECHSLDHIMLLSYNKEDNEIYVNIRLNHYRFIERVKRGIQYILGRKSRFGNFDEFIIQKEDAKKMIEILSRIDK